MIADFQVPSPIEVHVGFTEDDDGEAWLWVGEQGDSHPSCGVWIPHGVRGADLTVILADKLQEQFLPESRQAWAQARPPCPCHPHAASADMRADEPWWVCPVDGHPVAPIGRLGEIT